MSKPIFDPLKVLLGAPRMCQSELPVLDRRPADVEMACLLKTAPTTDGAEANNTKQEINSAWICPPRAERAAALASADPERVTDLNLPTRFEPRAQQRG